MTQSVVCYEKTHRWSPCCNKRERMYQFLWLKTSICRWPLVLRSFLFHHTSQLAVQELNQAGLKRQKQLLQNKFAIIITECILLCWLTSFQTSMEVKSVCVWYEILRPGFLCPVIKLAHEKRDYPVKTLASIVFVARKKTRMRKICDKSVVCVSLQHPAQDGRFGFTTMAFLCYCAVHHESHDGDTEH